MAKISVYTSEQQKYKLERFAKESNLSLSEYMLMSGLQKSIKSNKMMGELASFACKLYTVADMLENAEHRKRIKELGGELYGILENKTQN